jgi:hypothetical protein
MTVTSGAKGQGALSFRVGAFCFDNAYRKSVMRHCYRCEVSDEKPSGLTSLKAALGTMYISFNEFAYSESGGSFVGRDTDVFTHGLVFLIGCLTRKAKGNFRP